VPADAAVNCLSPPDSVAALSLAAEASPPASTYMQHMHGGGSSGIII